VENDNILKDLGMGPLCTLGGEKMHFFS